MQRMTRLFITLGLLQPLCACSSIEFIGKPGQSLAPEPSIFLYSPFDDTPANDNAVRLEMDTREDGMVIGAPVALGGNVMPGDTSLKSLVGIATTSIGVTAGLHVKLTF